MRQADGEIIIYWTLPVLAGIWISAFFLFPGFVHPMSPSMTARQVADFYRNPADLSRVRYQLRRPKRGSREIVETCATYWHTVDLLWILIFSLLYVVR
jgi:hypothetical protein